MSEFQYTNSMIMFYISSPLKNLFSSTNYLLYHRGGNHLTKLCFTYKQQQQQQQQADEKQKKPVAPRSYHEWDR